MSLGPDEIRARRERDVAALLSQISYLEEEIGLLRRKVADSPRQVRLLEERIAEAEGRAAFLSERNDKLAGTLRDAREQLVTLKEEVDRLGQPPSGYGVFLTSFDDGTVDVFTGGRKLRVSVSPNVEVETLRTGQEVMLNEAMNVVEARDFERAGDVVMLKELLEPIDGVTPRALVIGHTDEERVVYLADSLTGQPLRVGDSLLLESRSGYVYERIPKSEVEELVLEEVPDIDYSDIGGLSRQIEQIRDAVELPFLHSDLFREYELRPPKGILLYGPPGCSKTLLAKAVASQSGRNFLTVKGGELYSKWVGDSEKAVRTLFTRAKTNAPSVIFLDELDGLVGKRGMDDGTESGGGPSVSDRVLTMMLTMMDGVGSLGDGVAVVAATNRPDLVDPALLRPGRFDRLIYIPPPDKAEDRTAILRVLLKKTPLDDDVDLDALGLACAGYTGADLTAVVRESGLAALEESLEATKVSARHFTEGFGRVPPSPPPSEEMRAMYESFKRGGGGPPSKSASGGP